MIPRKRSSLAAVAAHWPLLLALAVPIAALADDKEGAERVRAHLIGYQEVPALASNGSAVFRAKIAEDELSFDWELTFSGLKDVTQAHIHFGQRAVNGGIVIWLCSNLPSPPTPAGVQSCPTSAGTVRGTARADNVVAVPGQNIVARDFARILDAIRSGVAYANVHTDKFKAGEIRGQIHEHD